MNRRGHGADLLARGILALHAWNRLEHDLRVAGGLAGEVPVDPDPVHLALFRDLDLADNRHVVLALAGDHARVAADAGIQVDRHPPLMALIVGVLREERKALRFVLEDAERAGPAASSFFGDRSSATVDSRTRGRPSMLPWSCVAESGYVRPTLVSLRPLSNPGALDAPDLERVEPHVRSNPSRAPTAVAKREGQHAVCHAGQDKDRKLERAARVIETDQLLVRKTERLGGLRAHERGVVPRELGQGIRKLLQPPVVREPAVVKRRRRDEHDLQTTRRSRRARELRKGLPL